MEKTKTSLVVMRLPSPVLCQGLAQVSHILLRCSKSSTAQYILPRKQKCWMCAALYYSHWPHVAIENLKCD
jgi:hypothetical protein